jgi:hypothetical protein
MQRMHEPMLCLPIYKPPYGRLTNLNRGEILWQVPNGDGPRNHPALKPLNLTPLGTAGRPAPLVSKTLLFIGEGSDSIPGVPKDAFGNKFRAYGRQYTVVPIGGKNHPPEFVALGLPDPASVQ